MTAERLFPDDQIEILEADVRPEQCQELYNECVAARGARIERIVRENQQASARELAALAGVNIRTIKRHRKQHRRGVTRVTSTKTERAKKLITSMSQEERLELINWIQQEFTSHA